MSQKVEHLHIRTSHAEKAVLAKAAHSSQMTVSQFVLRVALPVAEEIVGREQGDIQTLFKLDEATWTEFNRLLDREAKDVPQLRELLQTKAPWER
jgi:uncharacterized protein (DUF1778 family)